MPSIWYPKSRRKRRVPHYGHQYDARANKRDADLTCGCFAAVIVIFLLLSMYGCSIQSYWRNVIITFGSGG